MKKGRSVLLSGLCILALLVLTLLSGCDAQTTTAPKESKPAESLPVTLDVPYLSQKDILPTGCEAASAAMVLQYWGMMLSPEEVARLLPCRELYWQDGQCYGPDPREYFVGSPFEETGYGCYAPVIAQMIEEQFPGKLSVQTEYRRTIQQLYQEYVVQQNTPVLIWVTINLMETGPGAQWRLEDGSTFTWKKNEHCMVLIGKQDNRYLCQDPYENHGTLSLPEDLLQLRFEQMGSQAVAVTPA